jgi:hypothetical protein
LTQILGQPCEFQVPDPALEQPLEHADGLPTPAQGFSAAFVLSVANPLSVTVLRGLGCRVKRPFRRLSVWAAARAAADVVRAAAWDQFATGTALAESRQRAYGGLRPARQATGSVKPFDLADYSVPLPTDLSALEQQKAAEVAEAIEFERVASRAAVSPDASPEPHDDDGSPRVLTTRGPPPPGWVGEADLAALGRRLASCAPAEFAGLEAELGAQLEALGVAGFTAEELAPLAARFDALRVGQAAAGERAAASSSDSRPSPPQDREARQQQRRRIPANDPNALAVLDRKLERERQRQDQHDGADAAVGAASISKGRGKQADGAGKGGQGAKPLRGGKGNAGGKESGKGGKVKASGKRGAGYGSGGYGGDGYGNGGSGIAIGTERRRPELALWDAVDPPGLFEAADLRDGPEVLHQPYDHLALGATADVLHPVPRRRTTPRPCGTWEHEAWEQVCRGPPLPTLPPCDLSTPRPGP